MRLSLLGGIWEEERKSASSIRGMGAEYCALEKDKIVWDGRWKKEETACGADRTDLLGQIFSAMVYLLSIIITFIDEPSTTIKCLMNLQFFISSLPVSEKQLPVLLLLSPFPLNQGH